MNATTQFVRREVSDVSPWTETCGQIRPLIEEGDLAAGEVHHLEITDAKLHYHERTDEFYYVLGGRGRMTLDDSGIELPRKAWSSTFRGHEAPGVGTSRYSSFACRARAPRRSRGRSSVWKQVHS